MKKVNLTRNLYVAITFIVCYFYTSFSIAYIEDINTPVNISKTDNTVYISPSINIYHDKERSWSISNFQNHISRHPPLDINNTKNMGFTLNELYWGVFSVKNNNNNTTWMLQFREPLLDHLEVFIFNKSGELLDKSLHGRLHQRKDINKSSRFYNIEINIPKNDTIDVFFSVSSPDPYVVNVRLYDPKSFISSERTSSAWLGLYYGIIGCTLTFACFVIFLLRDRVFIYYMVAASCLHLICFINLNGLIPSTIPLYKLWFQRDILAWSINLGMTFFTLFARDFLCREDHLVEWKKYFNLLLIWPAINTIAFLFFDYKYIIIHSNVMISSISGIILLLALIVLMKNHREAIFFVLAWSTGILTGLVFSLKHWGIIPATVVTNNIWQAGMVVEGILFSLVLGRNILYERREKHIAQQNAIKNFYEAQKAKEKAMKIEIEKNKVALALEIDMKKKLEDKVKERTKDLDLMLKKLEEHNIQLTELSINDPLTQARNRRFFNERYLELWNNACHKEESIHLIMIDADHFKKINDEHGHLAGDHCLQIISKTISQHISGKHAFFARYGGEEFIAVIPILSLSDVFNLAESIRLSIEKIQFREANFEFKITISLGIAGMIPNRVDSPEHLIALCDEALYSAKNNGRNQTYTSHPVNKKYLVQGGI